MTSRAMANRYARALLDVALKESDPQQVERDLAAFADLMQQHGTRHLAVMKSGAIVGVLSVRDLLQPVSIDEF